MKPVVGRFLLALALFVAWMGWLGYLAVTAARPVVLSRAQFLVAEWTVTAHLDNKPDELTQVTVGEVFGPWGGFKSEPPGRPQPKGTIVITNLPGCKGWTASGEYILPLQYDPVLQVYRVAPLPPSPGYTGAGEPLIYPLNPQTRSQLESLTAPL